MSNMPGILRAYMALDKRRTSPEGLSVADYERWTELKNSLSRHFQPGAKAKDQVKRTSVRVPVRLRMGFESYGEIRESLMTNLSRGGLFIATPSPLEMGATLHLRIRIEESQAELQLEAEVVALNSGPGLKSEECGMGVKFVHLDQEQQKLVDELYEHSVKAAEAQEKS